MPGGSSNITFSLQLPILAGFSCFTPTPPMDPNVLTISAEDLSFAFQEASLSACNNKFLLDAPIPDEVLQVLAERIMERRSAKYAADFNKLDPIQQKITIALLANALKGQKLDYKKLMPGKKDRIKHDQRCSTDYYGRIFPGKMSLYISKETPEKIIQRIQVGLFQATAVNADGEEIKQLTMAPGTGPKTITFYLLRNNAVLLSQEEMELLVNDQSVLKPLKENWSVKFGKDIPIVIYETSTEAKGEKGEKDPGKVLKITAKVEVPQRVCGEKARDLIIFYKDESGYEYGIAKIADFLALGQGEKKSEPVLRKKNVLPPAKDDPCLLDPEFCKF